MFVTDPVLITLISVCEFLLTHTHTHTHLKVFPIGEEIYIYITSYEGGNSAVIFTCQKILIYTQNMGLML